MGKGSRWTRKRRAIAAYNVFYASKLFGLRGCDEHHSLTAKHFFISTEECGNYMGRSWEALPKLTKEN